ncbi:MAG: M20/M25/M40 family metallo-hydrolase [Fusobacteriaceae bacterium]|jgi:tripeptide aminopeptidase|nr:M20/M25/M40 family metallo-hydrolase [Fusobacteriaceae bacterium]
MVNEKRLIGRFLDLVKIPSPSLHERRVGEYLIETLQEMGVTVTEDEAGVAEGGDCGNITAFIPGNGKRAVMFTAHMDTVVPCETIMPVEEAGVIRTDGTSILGGDDKSGIAAMLETAQVLLENELERPDIVLAFSIGEEIGLLGAKHFAIEKYAPEFVYVLDSAGKPGVAVTKAPNSANGWIRIIGKAAHAGLAPETGINALTVAAHAITQIKLGRIDADTTANIGIVRGGEAANIVMPEVSMKYEARSFSAEKLDALLAETGEIFRRTAEKYGAIFENDVVKSYAGFDFPADAEILKPVREACANLGIPCVVEAGGGGSDANIYNGKGFSAINLSTGMSKVHTTEEYIEQKDIVDTARLILEMIRGLAG